VAKSLFGRYEPGRTDSSHKDIKHLMGVARHTEAHERLAVAVLLQAVKDCSRATSMRVQERGQGGQKLFLRSGEPRMTSVRIWRDVGKYGYVAAEARSFLSTPNEMLSFWCSILSIHPDAINEAYRTTIKGNSVKDSRSSDDYPRHY
jgi:hypothetical protein